MSKSLEEMMAEFEAKGGKVQEVPQGASFDPDVAPKFMFGAKPTAPSAIAIVADMKKKRNRVNAKGDEKLMEQIHQLKHTEPHAHAIYTKMQINHAKFQKLISRYAPDDPILSKYKAMPQKERWEAEDAKLLIAIKAELAAGTKGLLAISAICGASWQRVTRVAERNNLVIPRGDQNSKGMPVPLVQLVRWAQWIKEGLAEEVEKELRTLLERRPKT